MTKNNDNTKDFAEIDLDREKRTGFPEVIFGETKTPKQSALIAEKIYKKSNLFLITRTNIETFNEVKKIIPEAEFDEQAKMIYSSKKDEKYQGKVSVVNLTTARGREKVDDFAVVTSSKNSSISASLAIPPA